MEKIILAYDSCENGTYFCGPLTASKWQRSAICLNYSHLDDITCSSVTRIHTSDAIANFLPFAYIISWRYYIGYDIDHLSDIEDSILDRLSWLGSSPILPALRSGHGMLMFDDSYEGYQFSSTRSSLKNTLFQKLCKILNIPLSQLAFIDGNVMMLSQNLPHGVKFIHENMFEYSMFLFAKSNNLFDINEIISSPTKNYRFLSYARHWNQAREFFTFELFVKKLNTFGILSCGSAFAATYTANVFCNDMANLWDNTTINIEEVNNFLKSLPLCLDSDLVENLANNINLTHYKSTDISLIHETHTTNDSVFISEKTFKTIAAKHPFIIMGSPGTLALLHNLGYKTFYPYIDESYDTELNLTKRKNMIFIELEKLINMSDKVRTEHMINLLKIAEFNFEHLKNYSNRNTIGYNTRLVIKEHCNKWHINQI